MSVRLSNTAGSCGNRVTYGRKSCTPVFEIKSGEINIIEVDFCDGCSPCDAPAILSALTPTVDVDVMGTDGITAAVKSTNGCIVTLLIDADGATPQSKYTVRQTVNMDNCTRLSECFKVKVIGDCVENSCGTETAEQFISQERVCGTTVGYLDVPAGTTRVVINVSSEALQYVLDGSTPSDGPAIYANMGHEINLGSYAEAVGFRAEPYCAGSEAAFVATYYGSC